MEIIKRYGQIMACNMKYLLSKSDNEEKIIRVYLREINDEIKEADIANEAITKEESMLKGELDSYRSELNNIEAQLKETEDKTDLDELLDKKEKITRNINKIIKKQDIISENIKKISDIKEKLNADLKYLAEQMEILKKQQEEASKQEEEVVEIKGNDATKSIISNILSKLEKKEK